MSRDPRTGRSVRLAGVASVCFGAGSGFFLCTGGVALYFGIVAILVVAQHKEDASGMTQGTWPPGALPLLGIGIATIVLDILLTWTGIRILRLHRGARRLADASALVSLLPAAGILALVLGTPGFETGWMLVVAVWVHSAFAIGLATSLRGTRPGDRSPA